MLSAEAMARRQGKITATVARNIINAGDNDDALLLIFDRFIGAVDDVPENYAMRAGSAMEPVIINEYELQTGELLTRRQEIVDHLIIPDFCCTLDGWHASLRRVIECKFASPFMSREDLFAFYYPQVAFQMACTDAADGVLVIGQGTTEPFEIECVRDAAYEAELINRCVDFLACARTMTPPVPRPMPMPPPERWRTIDIALEQPNWGPELMVNLGAYDETKAAVAINEAAGKAARELVPADVGKVIAGEFVLSRNKRGVISIRRAA